MNVKRYLLFCASLYDIVIPLLSMSGCLVILFDIEDYSALKPIMPAFGLHMHQGYEFAVLKFTYDKRSGEETRNSMLTYMVGCRLSVLQVTAEGIENIVDQSVSGTSTMTIQVQPAPRARRTQKSFDS